jgi:diguanylate cyclase
MGFAPVGIARKDELGELARNFEVMHLNLQTDKLTSVFNRETFEKQVSRRIDEHRVGARAASFAVLFVDFDHFKKINDELGHKTGDDVLVELADRLKRGVRAGDIVGRYGGDEFVVLLSEVDNAAAVARVREKIEQKLRVPLRVGATETATMLTLSASVGIAIYPGDGADVASLLAVADSDMYHHKRASRIDPTG